MEHEQTLKAGTNQSTHVALSSTDLCHNDLSGLMSIPLTIQHEVTWAQSNPDGVSNEVYLPHTYTAVLVDNDKSWTSDLEQCSGRSGLAAWGQGG